MRGKYESALGLEINGLRVTEELGHDQVMMQCTKCLSTAKYGKGTIRHGTARCKNRCCENYRPNFVNTVGKVHCNMIVENELGGNRIQIKCLSCNSELIVNKTSFLKSTNYKCTVCFPRNVRFVDRTNQVFNNIIVIKECENNTVLGQCEICGKTYEYNKKSLVGLKAKCKNKDCPNRNTRAIDRTNQSFNGLTIIKELKNKRVIASCNKCGYKSDYEKSHIIDKTALCPNCGIYSTNMKRIEGHTINNVKIIRYEWLGRTDKKYYYSCRCLQCGEEVILDYDSIFTYQCTKE